ncbi:MAG: hypothetical protein WCL30_02255 [Pseudomonadota bacterium]
MATIYSTLGHSSISFGGETYQGVDGAFDVPEEAFGILIESFGFTTEAPQSVVAPVAASSKKGVAADIKTDDTKQGA